MKKGYSGVGIYLRDSAERVVSGLDCEEFDPEGRIIRADWKNLSVVSAYLPVSYTHLTLPTKA